ncbi:hypothetical protein Pmani_024056 [Petrolisthes manimaculis]|uniref:Uncharacterized protein n=1 Tax=Petrolisthes manimaculis TaxID=1843537 RepID=A0AAE1P8Z9_9EUCA|nr:hypothetical protein Pmani_024056 [Petrolisthes manimaculis]
MKCGGAARARPAPASWGRPLLQEEPRYQLVEGHSGCTFLVLIAHRRPDLDSGCKYYLSGSCDPLARTPPHSLAVLSTRVNSYPPHLLFQPGAG